MPNATGADGLPKNLPFRGLGVLGLALLLAGAEAGVEARWLSGAAAGAALRRGVDDMEMGIVRGAAARALTSAARGIGRRSRFLVAPNFASKNRRAVAILRGGDTEDARRFGTLSQAKSRGVPSNCASSWTDR